MDADAELQAALRGRRLGGGLQLRLDLERAGHGADRGLEHRKHRVARHVDHAAAIGVDPGLENFPCGIERGQRRPLVARHEARVASDVGSENGC